MKMPVKIFAFPLVTSALASAALTARDSPLLPFSFTPLPLGSVKANGWLQAELEMEANGLAGHMHDFIPDITDGNWLGGSTSYSTLNEGVPYWFNGLVPLAYTVDDEQLKDQVHAVAGYITTHQLGDGWIGPETDPNSRTFWARYPLVLGLMNLVDANSTWGGPVVDTLGHFVDYMLNRLQNNYTDYWYHDGVELQPIDFTWGRVRYADMIVSLQWLFEKHPAGKEQELLDTMNFLYNGSIDWNDWYVEGVYPTQDLSGVPIDPNTSPIFPYEHGVNVGQGLKSFGVVRRLTGNDSLIDTAMNAVNWTFTYHGSASGTIIADEILEGLNPWSGSETCTAVETMYSLSYLYQTLGDAYYADRTELLTYNAMFAQLTSDWWGHQYMAQPNQPYCEKLSTAPFWNVNVVGQTFGLQPNYPCCQFNHPQGLPKFVMATYATTGDGNGLVHALLGPTQVTTTLSSGNVNVSCDTAYPFDNTLTYTIQSDGNFDFYVRVPAWHDASSSSISTNSGPSTTLSPDPVSGLHKLNISAGQTTVTYTLGSQIWTEIRPHDTISVHRGALVYALEINSTESTTAPHQWNNLDAAVTFSVPDQCKDFFFANETAWNYAIDPSTMTFHSSLDVSGDLSMPFAPGESQLWIEAQACLIPWDMYLDSVPGIPSTGSSRTCLGDAQTVRLVPYGSAKTRIGDIPTISI
ncbi:hypothetical protein GYMLUDRAFT_206165 [Collybiopsis luxurians FD-317 M1]|uniref:Uncharacterized protein n=1 Tax=Collybiopsis luxurians FD-317 M1 TaxID=944289 RepID=A0A0D0BYE1_9AGAR|nr:hypothetical protein GYMLUDRAFT_206165 [Collybiopsis luxurians FD-317 M1]